MRIILFLCLTLLLFSCRTESKNSVKIVGLEATVEIKRDQWGINHIYAENEHDLFFAQGYAAARDRLFQFEIWRRQATGTVAEILGEREFDRDLGTHLFKFRGDMTEEMNYYHPRGVEIITAYTDGVNAYIEEILKTPEKLPIEFKLLGIEPEKWTPEVVISRHQGLLGNIEDELEIGRAVAVLGTEKVKDLYWFHPKDPDIRLDPSIDTKLLMEDILAPYKAFRKKVVFRQEDIVPDYRHKQVAKVLLNIRDGLTDPHGIGSNNWVIDDSRTVDGHTYMANDPHRTIAVPSLRYMAHLVAPGWNVIGGGEPEIPGISIGHNEYGSWGLTVFETDGEDLYVYDLNPENPDQYRYGDGWEEMRQIKESIAIKGKENREVTLRYTRHGPVTMVDTMNHKAYAVRCAWLEPGGSPYLASLRMDQAKNWEEFRDACSYSHIPGENMIWADKEGNIGWQAVGIAPIRPNFSGLVPVPGNGAYEWNGYLPIKEKPHDLNPGKGFIATANQNVIPEDYEHWNAVGYTWADPYRGYRIEEVLSQEKSFSMEDMKALQVDYVSIPARKLTPLILDLQFTGKVAEAQQYLKNWDHYLGPESVPAAIYVAFENTLGDEADAKFIPEAAKDIISYIQMKRIIDWVTNPDDRFGSNPEEGRDEFLHRVFMESVSELEQSLGPDIAQWQYGQAKFKHSAMVHSLGEVVNDSLAGKMNLGPLPRGGNSYTPGSTGGNKQQSSGASFRMIVNSGDWDATEATNAPGQSGDPESDFYDNLFESWAKDEYFPVYFSDRKVDSVTVERLLLIPPGE